MKSLQWRMLAALALVIVLTWAISVVMFVAYMSAGRANVITVRLHATGNALADLLPESLLHQQDRSHKNESRGINGSQARHTSSQSLPQQPPPSPQDEAGGSSEPGNILNAVVFNTLQLAILGLLMWLAVFVSFRSLKAMSNGLAMRKAFDTTPLEADKVPSELRPLILAFNSLLMRVDAAMQAERQFIADAAHELRTPLAALHVQGEVALRAETLPRKDEALKKLLGISHRTHRLAEQLLDLARLDAGLHSEGLHRIDLRSLSQHVIDEFSMQAREKGTRLSLAGSPCFAKCDIDEIGILIRNLVDNAIRHGRANGRVEVLTGYTSSEDGRHPQLEVRDDGPGVPDTEHAAIFTRFYRGEGGTAQGSGIGLSLVAGIAALHDAVIETGKGKDGLGFSIRIVFPSEN